MERDNLVTRVGQQHFHVRVGPDEVDIYGVMEMPYAGPYYDFIVDDPEEAAEIWIDMLITHIDGLLTEEEQEELFEDIVSCAGLEPGFFGFEMNDLGFTFRLEECYGCIPKHNN